VTIEATDAFVVDLVARKIIRPDAMMSGRRMSICIIDVSAVRQMTSSIRKW
jgi:uncharacterized protein YrrD